MKSFSDSYLSLLKNLLETGKKKAPRGMGVTFFQNYVFEVEEPGDVFSSPSREYRWDYVVKELELYFSGEMSAEKFGAASKFWLKLANPDGNINSNYGNLVFYKSIDTKFGSLYNQWTWAKNQLIADKDTRQAIMFISSPHVQFTGNKDFICTLNYTFSIFEDKLSIEVNRRSQDVILGLPYDYVFEYLLLVKMHNELLPYYPELKIGSYTMFCNNIHMYDKNKELVQNMLSEYKESRYDKLMIEKNLPDHIMDDYVMNPRFGNVQENRIFFLEGCDRTGKSTFAKNLCEALKKIGKKPIIYHMTGPSKYSSSLEFSTDEKSLIQLAKFDEDFNMMRQMIEADKDIIFILDRSQFGEYVWSQYFDRHGKFTNFNCSEEFYKRHADILNKSLYISYVMSDMDKLIDRILVSGEDIKNYTKDPSIIVDINSEIKKNITSILTRFSDLNDFVKNDLHMRWIEIDSAQFETVEDNRKWVEENVDALIQNIQLQR